MANSKQRPSSDLVIRDQTISLVMTGLRGIMANEVGSHRPFGLTTRIIDYLQEIGVFEEFDFDDLMSEIEEVFGIPYELLKSRDFFGECINDKEIWNREIKNRLCFADVAEFIVENDPFADTNGVEESTDRNKYELSLLLLKRIVAFVDPKAEAVSPDSKIGRSFCGKSLKRLWKLIQWRSNNRIPPLRSTWRGRICRWFGGKALLMAAIAVISSQLFRFDEMRFAGLFTQCLFLFLIVGGIWVCVSAVLLLVTPFVAHRDCGLPHGITTFGDLARLIADE